MARSRFSDILERHYKYFIIGGVFLILIIILIVFLVARSGDDSESEGGTSESSVEVPKDKYEVNAYPNVNSLMETYYTAMMNGDTDTIASVCDVLSDAERFRMEEKAKYYQSADNFVVYTKKGYRDNSYFVLVTFNILYSGASTPAPSLDSTYVCTNESGALYVNKSDLSEEEQAYLLELTVQSDVEELIDKVNVDYNKAIEGDPNLAQVISTIDAEVSEAVKERLSEQQRLDAEAAAEQEAAAQAAAQAAGATEVRAKKVVNIRSSPSTEASILGKTESGQTFTRYEAMENGWSKVDYNGTEAYISSEFLEEVQSAPTQAADGTSVETVTVKSGSGTINVRSSASTADSSNKIGSASGGDTFELIERLDGWCKIKYNGQEAYISSDFVE
ncbi:MAG: SH3 domain-containing protein [Lachnospiraceae bacterium]|nr:SH3 domain-containing protein [Lachnospiraceae bacterium]